MYEQPMLTTIGEAKEVIRGITYGGYDIDALLLIRDQEFQSDAECDSLIGE
jgi:hypothetical protein